MASGNIFKLLAEIKALKLDYEGAVKYLTDQGIEVVGIVKQGLDNFFKKIKARDPDFGNVVKELPIDDAGVPFNPNTLKSTPEKRGVENLFEETKKLPEVKMGSRINYQAIADKAGIDVELIRGKSWEEIMEIIKGKADGGRVGFVDGGWADDLTGSGLSIYNSMTSGGHSDETIQNTLRELGYWGGDGTVDTGLQSIVNTQPAITGGGSKDYMSATPQFNQVGLAGLKEYGPGGVYERNPASLGFQFDDSGAVIRPQGGITEQDWITSTAGIPGQDFTKSDILNQYENFNTLGGRKSAYEDARVEGTMTKPLSWLLSAGLGAVKKIPGVTTGLEYLKNKFPSSGATGSSDRTRWAVDDVGYGIGTGRDQFGVFTGGKTLLGKTANYQERMQNEISQIANSFGLSEDDLMSLDEKALTDLKNRSGFNYRKVVDYVNKINVKAFDKIESDRIEQERILDAAAKSRAESARQYDPNVHGPNNYGLGSDGQQSFDSGQGFGINATTGGPVSNKTGKGRQDWAQGGLATMFQRR